eukprot:CAMPEP_0196593810 /NCGR_PEP_ID=MMETSP1081-20130531/76647_1 /TAXON_ID=36882 /ORGANISM="Pyramimonas amylifera, Strain CCMP720" /LENGTH=85 /DNA_ID=CAMNT_0041917905 /DNA_START=55 /DNA_END=312 /DNA_ORIENTATION=-
MPGSLIGGASVIVPDGEVLHASRHLQQSPSFASQVASVASNPDVLSQNDIFLQLKFRVFKRDSWIQKLSQMLILVLLWRFLSAVS